MYIFFIIGCLLVGVVQVGMIQISVKAAGYLIFSLLTPCICLSFQALLYFLFWLLSLYVWFTLGCKEKLVLFAPGIMCLTFILIGYSSYLTTLIRSNADPAVDMYNVDNPMSLVGYLGRDQYGDFPILYGQKFTAAPVDSKETYSYQKSNDKYIKVVRSYSYVYNKEDKMVFSAYVGCE